MSGGPVDFLLVVAVPEELTAVKNHIKPSKKTANLLATVGRANTADTVTVGVVDIAGMGPSIAQSEVSQAISNLRPARVLLVGIAAGFPERGVKFGDVMVPYALVPYDLSKVTTNQEGNLVRQYRTVPVPVSEPLWRTAYDIAQRDEPSWSASIVATRPDGTEGPPAVHCARKTLLGSGPELTAAKKSETRGWLLECMAPETKHVVVGLEMEGAGAWQACRSADTPFLLVKAMQDDATERKDQVDQDLWRDYAADASAAFAVEIIRNFEPSAEDPVAEHLREAARTARAFEERLPRPRFERTVRRAETPGLLRTGIYTERELPPERLVPDAAHASIRLHGEGGAGKSTLVRGLLLPMLGAGLVPLFLDLGEYAVAPRNGSEPSGSSLEELVRLASAPRTELSRLRQLAVLGRLAIVVDGLNQIGIQARIDLVDLLLRLRSEGECYLLVTERFGSEDPHHPFQQYELEPLAESTVERVFDEQFSVGQWKRLNPSLRQALGRPFFLNLALRLEGEDFADAGFLAGVFEQFCLRHGPLAPSELDRVAAATVTVFEREGNVRTASVALETDDALVGKLVSAGVLEADAGFTHDLWRDYFLARRLAVDRSLWRGAIFDLATAGSATFESLRLTVEQIPSAGDKDDFLTEVFDWNWPGALECLAGDEDSVATGPSGDVRLAVVAAAAERRFDLMQRTARRANEYLSRHRYPLAARLGAAKDRSEIVREIVAHHPVSAWFDHWRRLFSIDASDSLPTDAPEAVRYQNALVGWAAANAIYRARTDDAAVAELARIYEESVGENLRSVRWRVVHALGGARGPRGVDVLLRVLEQESDDWVLYGVIRSLVVQAGLDGSDRERILTALQEFVGRYDPARAYMRTRVLEELVESAFVNDNPDWRRLAAPVVRNAASRVDSTAREVVAQRAEEFATTTADRLTGRSVRWSNRVVRALPSWLRRILLRRH